MALLWVSAEGDEGESPALLTFALQKHFQLFLGPFSEKETSSTTSPWTLCSLHSRRADCNAGLAVIHPFAFLSLTPLCLTPGKFGKFHLKQRANWTVRRPSLTMCKALTHEHEKKNRKAFQTWGPCYQLWQPWNVINFLNSIACCGILFTLLLQQ